MYDFGTYVPIVYIFRAPFFALMYVGTVYPKCFSRVCLYHTVFFLMLNSHFCLFVERQEVLVVFILRDVGVYIRA
jgi:hypothetical protein